MASISRSALLPYSAARIYAVVDDIAAYPQFMQGCVASTILQRDANSVTATLELGKAGFRYTLTTRNLLEPPQQMRMTLIEGPFRKFDALWRFTELNEHACKVTFDMSFEFNAGLVDKMLRALFESTSSEMVNAIARRAEQLYGKT